MTASSTKLRVACLQVNASDNMQDNIDTACDLARHAHAQGARFLTLPENAVMMTWGRQSLLENGFTEADHPALAAFQALATELESHILIGSLHILIEDGQRLANRSFLIGPDGTVQARYDKIHMFDVELDNGESYRESAVFAPGEEAVLADMHDIKIGMAICYDLRFPHLFRQYAQAGAQILTVPAAFTQTTGEAHWHALLRARAIETGCYVIAPAQTGIHANDRATFGHSLIIDPWGKVLADAKEIAPGVILSDIDMNQVEKRRKQIPSLTHDRQFAIRSAG